MRGQPQQVLLDDGVVLLRPLHTGDAHALLDAVRESVPAISPWLPWCTAAYSLTDAESWIATCEHHWQRQGDREFGVFDSHTGRLLGCAGVNQQNLANRFANIGYWVRTADVGRGVATRAVRLLAAFAFEALDLHRIEIVTLVDNLASRRVAERADFLFEGTARHRLLIRDQPRDGAMYARIRGA